MTDSRSSKLPTVFKQARSRLTSRVQGLLRDVNLTESQWRVLDYINKTPRPDINQLKQHASTAAGNLLPVLDALAKAGLIEYETNPDDESRQTIKLTTRGYFILQRINPKAAFLYSQIDSKRQSQPVKRAIKSVTQILGTDNSDKENY
ncbi:MAG TPA: MarR family transcriptional regulator [Paenalcaligenes sp.]|nr:MarR family transcriptional regulator [Paenalcaligenes sp.]